MGIKKHGPSQPREANIWWPFSFYTVLSFFCAAAFNDLLYTKTQFQLPGTEHSTQLIITLLEMHICNGPRTTIHSQS